MGCGMGGLRGEREMSKIQLLKNLCVAAGCLVGWKIMLFHLSRLKLNANGVTRPVGSEVAATLSF